MPNAESLFSPELSFSKTQVTANAEDSVLVTFTLKDLNGNVMKDASGVEVAFSSTFGNLAEKRVTAQNGVATVLLKSETLDKAQNAIVTAQVVEANNKNLYGLQKQSSIPMDPNPNSGKDQTVGATMTQVQASQADRVTVFFNKDVDVAKYAIKGTSEYNKTKDNTKADISVYSKVANDKLTDPASDDNANKSSQVIGIAPVQGNSRALQLILDKPLTDNSNVAVNFVDKTGSLNVSSTESCKLTDSRRPAMLGVERNGLKELKVTFSEPVEASTANSTLNWVIDGVKLSDDVYGLNTTKATAVVGDFKVADGTDTRNVVTITLGKDKDGNQIYFKPGTHSIQGSGIGDWANLTDLNNNVMNTETLDFAIPEDKDAPNATVEVQSPEQYVVSFDKDLVSNLTNADIKLQKYNKDKATWEDYTKQTLKVTKIADASKYKVEVTKDWTDKDVYDTTTSHLNYYNDSYRLVIPTEKVANAANGIKNVEQDLTLGGAMTTPDLTSPVISDIKEIKNADGTIVYNAIMSEPVKIAVVNADGTISPSADSLDTLAEGQKALPQVTAQFIKKDGSKTIDGTVSAYVKDQYDKTISVVPKTALDNGDWTLVVRSISDDIGNTAASATRDFTVKTDAVQADNKFAVKWAFADQDTVLNPAEHGDGDNTADYIYVKFNKAESITGDATNVLKTSNYSLDGEPLPTGTQITANIAGYDDKDGVNDSITIKLKQGTLNHKNAPHVLTISSYLESTTAGDALTNGGAKTLAWNIADADGLVSDMAQTLLGSNATVGKDAAGHNVVTVTNTDAKLVDLLTVSNISTIPTVKIGTTTLADSAMSPAAVKAALVTALGKPAGYDANQLTLADLVGKTIEVNGTNYTVGPVTH
ncbi:Ig-like domain-containing protein [Clostridium muellerianum]|nr:Ig-like domain-containing protein [Clostridium muellerianum]